MVPDKIFFTRGLYAFNELHDAYLLAVAQRPHHHAKGGTGLAFAVTGEQNGYTTLSICFGDGFIHSCLLLGHGFVVFGVAVHGVFLEFHAHAGVSRHARNIVAG